MHSPIKRVLLPVSAAFALAIGANAGAQTIGYNIRTGDVWMDSRLVEINDYGYRYREPFVSEVVTTYAVPRPYVETLLVQRKWKPADVYYACALAHSLGRPCSDVAEEYERDRGQGWGVTARRLGIKPGSPQFFALKNGFVGTYTRWGHPIVIDRVTHVRWDKHADKLEKHERKRQEKIEKHEFKQAKHDDKHAEKFENKAEHGKGHGHEKG